MPKQDYRNLTKEQLIGLLEARERKRFGLVWERDSIEHDRALNDDFVVLDHDPDLSCGDGPYENLIIEGDNFDVLRALRTSYAGQVKCIYIDPPYNTGNRDFVYNDHFVDKDHAWRHSMWLEFLYRRLILAKDLLSEKGVILVSINDENRSKLELLMDEVFPGMRLGSFTWRTKDTGNDSGGNMSQVHEHILAYAGSQFTFQGKPVDNSKYSNTDNDPNGAWDGRPLTKAHSFKERPNTYYPIQNPDTGLWYPCDPFRVWAYSSRSKLDPDKIEKLRTEPIEDMIQKGLIYFPPCEKSQIKQWDTLEELQQALKDGKGPVSPKKKTPLLTLELPDLEFWVGKPIAHGRPTKKAYLKDKKDKAAPISSWIAGTNDNIDYPNSNLKRNGEAWQKARVLGRLWFNRQTEPK